MAKLATTDIIALTRGAFSLVQGIIKEVKEKREDDGKISLEEGLEIVNAIAPQILEIVMVFVRDED